LMERVYARLPQNDAGKARCKPNVVEFVRWNRDQSLWWRDTVAWYSVKSAGGLVRLGHKRGAAAHNPAEKVQSIKHFYDEGVPADGQSLHVD